MTTPYRWLICCCVLFPSTILADETPWPTSVPNHEAIQPGEHPRLFFRKADVPELRKRANTPEGQALLKRLRVLLNGSDGESMPTLRNDMTTAYGKNSGPKPRADEWPDGTYSISHVAGYGLLYQLTGDRKYAELGKRCFEWAFEGVRDRDREGRYSWKEPGGALRAGPSLGWYAVGYDLCYDGWEPEFREKVAQAIQGYNQGKFTTLPELVRGARHMPSSNHWGMQVGGGALALLAIMGDPGVDQAKLEPLLQQSEKAMIRNLTEGFGNRGWYAEGDGTGCMASNIAFASALQAWRVAGGKDFISPRPNAAWMYLKWVMNTLPIDGSPVYPKRGAYPHNVWDRDGISGPGTFCLGFGILPDQYKPAMLWLYDQVARERDETNDTPFETSSGYPHHAVMAFLNWPFDQEPQDPATVMPRAVQDSMANFCSFRNRWRDRNDILITLQALGTRGWHRANADGQLWIWANGKQSKWGQVLGRSTYFEASDTGGILTVADGTSLAVDFSGASGAEAMLVLTGRGAPQQGSIMVGEQRYSFHFITSNEKDPEPTVTDNVVTVGGQTITIEDGNLKLGVFGRGVSVDAPTVALAGEPFTIGSIRYTPSSDDTDLASATLRFRPQGSETFLETPLNRDGEQYSGTVPGEITKEPFEYVLAFKERNGTVITFPERGDDNPLLVIPDATPPVMTGDLRSITPKSYRVRLEWPEAQDDRGLAAYRLYRQMSGTERKLLHVAKPDERRYLDTDPPTGKKAIYSVEPVDVAGRVGEGRSVEVLVPEDGPPLSSLRPSASGVSKQVVVTWRGTVEPDVTTILIERSVGEGEYQQVTAVPFGKAFRWLDEDVESDKPYRYRLKLKDAGGFVSEPSPSVSAVPGTYIRRINCGGPEVVGEDGILWEADLGGGGGLGTTTVETDIDGATEALQSIYRTERWANAGMRYTFDLEPGTYSLRLMFAETNTKFAKKGARVFDLEVNGETKVEAIDLFDTVGANKAHEIRIELPIERAGRIEVVLRRTGGVGPAIKGIEVKQVPQ